MRAANDVLRNVYARRASFPVFELTRIAGHPAIRTKNNVDGTSCFFRIAAAQRQTLSLMFTSLRHGLEEPCGPATALAEAVLANGGRVGRSSAPSTKLAPHRQS